MHIFFSVGEPSGDQHAAELIEELRYRAPDCRITGYGGPLMERAGCERLFPLTDIAVMGFFRVLPLLWTFYKLIRKADRFLKQQRPDMVILIDAPAFNWWIARKAKKRGIPVCYYLPPQLWAWAPWRVAKVRRFVDIVVSGLSFEVDWYRQRGVECDFVGHPFFDEVARHQLDHAFIQSVREDAEKVVGLLPGSRRQEVTNNFPIMLDVVQQLHAEHPQTRFHVACFNDQQRQFCEDLLERKIATDASLTDLDLSLSVGRTPEIIEAADCCLMVSGSVSLELLARRTPAVVLYRGTWWLMVLKWILMRCPFITLPNLMAGRELMPEFVFAGNWDVPAARMSSILSEWLSNEADRLSIVRELDRLAADVAQPGGTSRTADLLLNRLDVPARQKAA